MARALIRGDRGLSEAGFEEVQRLGVLRFDSRAHASAVLGDELHEEVLQLRRLASRLVRQRVVVHRLRSADFVDAHDEGLHVSVSVHDIHVERDQGDGDP